MLSVRQIRHLPWCLAVSLLLTLACVDHASGALTYNLRLGTSNVTLGSGQSTTLDIFFDEVATDGDTHRLGSPGPNSPPNPDFGLTAGNLSVTRSGSGSSTITAATSGADFDFSSQSVGTPTTTISNGVFFNPPVEGTLAGNTRSVSLGSITITGGSPGSVNDFQLGDFDPSASSDDFLIGDGFGNHPAGLPGGVVDGQLAGNFGSVTVTAIAIPEPGSLAALTLGGLCVRLRQRRRAKAKRRSWC